MPVTITFKTMKEEVPKDDRDVLVYDVEEMSCGSSRLGYGVLRSGRVEHQWMTVDEEGHSTGEFLDWEPDDQPHRLLVTVDGQALTDESLWVYADDLP